MLPESMTRYSTVVAQEMVMKKKKTDKIFLILSANIARTYQRIVILSKEYVTHDYQKGLP